MQNIITLRRSKDINISNLSPGLTIKNYKELCNILGIKITSGEARQKQLKDLKYFCEYKKEGNKFIITKVHKTPVITVNELKQVKYIKQLSNIIIEYLYNSNELEQVSLFKLLNVLGITNINYENVNVYRKEFSQITNIQLASIYYFYSNTKLQFKRIVESCLNDLKKRRVLNWYTCYMVIDTNNKKVYKADKELESLIIDTEYMVLQELDKTMFEIMKDKKLLKEFNRLVNLETGGLSYYHAYDLTIGSIALKCEYENIMTAKQELNNLIIHRVNDTFNRDKFAKYKNDYELLINSLININNADEDLIRKLELKRDNNKDTYKNLKKELVGCIDIYNNKDLNLDSVEW